MNSCVRVYCRLHGDDLSTLIGCSACRSLYPWDLNGVKEVASYFLTVHYDSVLYGDPKKGGWF